MSFDLDFFWGTTGGRILDWLFNMEALIEWTNKDSSLGVTIEGCSYSIWESKCSFSSFSTRVCDLIYLIIFGYINFIEVYNFLTANVIIPQQNQESNIRTLLDVDSDCSESPQWNRYVELATHQNQPKLYLHCQSNTVCSMSLPPWPIDQELLPKSHMFDATLSCLCCDTSTWTWSNSHSCKIRNSRKLSLLNLSGCCQWVQ